MTNSQLMSWQRFDISTFVVMSSVPVVMTLQTAVAVPE